MTRVYRAFSLFTRDGSRQQVFLGDVIGRLTFLASIEHAYTALIALASSTIPPVEAIFAGY